MYYYSFLRHSPRFRHKCLSPLEPSLKPWEVIVCTISGTTCLKSDCDDIVTSSTNVVKRSPSRSAMAWISSPVGTNRLWHYLIPTLMPQSERDLQSHSDCQKRCPSDYHPMAFLYDPRDAGESRPSSSSIRQDLRPCFSIITPHPPL